MGSLNKVILIGNLGQDPELKSTASTGRNVCSFSIATHEVYNNKAGERQEKTEWHRIVTWDRQAETCARYLQKGKLVCIEGKLRTREWTDQNNQKRYTTEIQADRVTFLGGREEGSYQQQSGGYQNRSQGYGNQNQSPDFGQPQQDQYYNQSAPAQKKGPMPPGDMIEDDDLPF